MIQTVLGWMDENELGYCQCHEHLFIRKGKSYDINKALYMDDMDKSVRELMLYKECGGESLVDAQPVGCGRMAECLGEASRQSGINIIASTGFHKLLFYGESHWIHEMDEAYLTRLFIDEIRAGMYDDGDSNMPALKTAFRAGIIKTAAEGPGVCESYKKLFTAAAYASVETGSPILCHIENGKDAFSVIEFLTSLKVSPCSIILCHLDRAHYDMAYHRQVAQTGVYLEYDTIGRFKYHSDETEIDLIGEMVSSGHSSQLLLGLDTTNGRLRNYGGEIGLDYIRSTFQRKMLDAGISKEAIKQFTVENPAKALSMKASQRT